MLSDSNAGCKKKSAWASRAGDGGVNGLILAPKGRPVIVMVIKAFSN